jgi:hypothetical protein
MKNLLRSSFVCFSNAEGGYGRNFATTMTNWQMLQHWQAEYTCNKEEEAAALKLAYDKEPLPYLCFWISKVTLNQGRRICWSWFIVYTLAKEFSCDAAG